MNLAAILVAATAGSATAGLTFFEGAIDGSQEAPNPTSSAAVGNLTGVYDDVANTFTFSWDITGPLSGTPTVSHIHAAPAGTGGPVVFGFNDPGGGWALSDTKVWSGLSQDNIDDLFAEGLYLNFHTSAFPGGEIRGQILLVPAPGAAAALGTVGLLAARRRRSM